MRTWNSNYRKLTTSDENGLIIVWMLHKQMWFEEMINNRNKSTVRGMRWTPDGQRICIIYEDGMVIVGSVDGNRLWGKELKTRLAHVAGRPTAATSCSARSTARSTCTTRAAPSSRRSTSPSSTGGGADLAHRHRLVRRRRRAIRRAQFGGAQFFGAIFSRPIHHPPPHRYDGAEGLQDADQPTLAIGLENGRLQLMRRDTDDAPILVDTGTLAASIRWNTSGSVLAVAGSQNAARRRCRWCSSTLRSGSTCARSRCRARDLRVLVGGRLLRLALAVDSYIYFANIRPDYKWGAFAGTVACAYTSPERADWSVLFWAEKTDERRVKHVKRLVHVAAAGEHAVMVQAVDAPSSAAGGEMNGVGMGGPHHSVVLCSAIGAPLDTKTIAMEPKCVAMSPYHVCAASSDHIYVWQYRTLMSRLTSVDEGGGASSLRRKEGRERAFHIDDAPSATQGVEALAIAGTRDGRPIRSSPSPRARLPARRARLGRARAVLAAAPRPRGHLPAALPPRHDAHQLRHEPRRDHRRQRAAHPLRPQRRRRGGGARVGAAGALRAQGRLAVLLGERQPRVVRRDGEDEDDPLSAEWDAPDSGRAAALHMLSPHSPRPSPATATWRPDEPIVVLATSAGGGVLRPRGEGVLP